jgi:hypothetical protein
MEEKLSHFQGLEAIIDHLQKVIEMLLRLNPADSVNNYAMHPPQTKDKPAQQDQRESPTPTTAPTTSKKPPTPPLVAPNTSLEELSLKPKAITMNQPASHPIFDVWKIVEKKGKQSADTLVPKKSKQNAQRETPTKIKERKETP